MARMAGELWRKERKNRKLVYVDIFEGYDEFFSRGQLYDAMNLNSLEATSSKDNQISIAFATRGNMLGIDIENTEHAIKEVNKSLCFAENGCEEVGLAYALRAYFFFRLKQYSLSLADIDLARNSNYPPFMRPILDERQNNSLRAMDAADGEGKGQPLTEQPALSFPADENISCFAQGLEVKESRNFGKHIVTNRSLEIGQTVIVEEAYCMTAENVLNYSQCANCFECKVNLIPCKNCSSIMFCSQNCYDVGHRNFHAVECGQLGVYSKWNAAIRLVTNSVIKAINSFPNLKKLMNVIDEFNKRGPNSNVTYDNPLIRAYMQFFALSGSTELTSHVQDLIFMERTKSIHSQIISHPTYKNMFQSNESRRFLAHLIMHHFHVVNFNGFKVVNRLHGAYINELGTNSAYLSGITYAYGIYLNSSRLNHSCQPNIARIFIGNKLIAKVIRPIKPGEQLFVTYL